MKSLSTRRTGGFTIVELLVVIVVIGVLSTIGVVSYNGIQERARTTKIKSDLRSLVQAIELARTNTGTTLWGITGGRPDGDENITSDECGWMPNGTKLEDLPPSSSCWTKYNDTLNAISEASGSNIRHLKDPYGRPYAIYEQEGWNSNCGADAVSVYLRPHVSWQFMWGDIRQEVPKSLVTCPE